MIGIEGIVGGDGWALVPGHHGAAPRRVLGVAALFGGDWRRDGGEKSRWARERRDSEADMGMPSQLDSEVVFSSPFWSVKIHCSKL